MSGAIVLRVPLPPPLSACFTNARGYGRVPTARYTAWQVQAGLKVRQQLAARVAGAPVRLAGPVRVTYLVGRPDARQRDLGNLDKALSDLLTRQDVIDDDSAIVDLRLAWTTKAGVEAIIEPAEPVGVAT